MLRKGGFFPVRREQNWGLSPWSDWGFAVPTAHSESSPWQVMRRMQDDMDRLFNRLGSPAETQTAGSQAWAPSLDVSQDEREWLIEVDLPGVPQDRIDVQLQENLLRVRAEPGGQPEGTEGQSSRQYHRRERRTGCFERVLTLPQNIDDEQLSCDFRDGVLRIHIPKVAPAVPPVRRIPIRTAQETVSELSGRADAVKTVSESANGQRKEPVASGS